MLRKTGLITGTHGKTDTHKTSFLLRSFNTFMTQVNPSTLRGHISKSLTNGWTTGEATSGRLPLTNSRCPSGCCAGISVMNDFLDGLNTFSGKSVSVSITGSAVIYK